ncbi:Ribonuclease H-like superfamily [Sesbania bispinosa]|nr:Ribonuclease H-like superfamily [Sesbania bispinosa]
MPPSCHTYPGLSLEAIAALTAPVTREEANSGGSRGWHLVPWNKVIAPKLNGGLAIREARLMNISLLWTVGNASHAWKSILKALDFYRAGFDFRLASGNSSLWFSDWSRQGNLCNRVPFVHVSDLNLQVRDIWDGSNWHLDHLHTIIPDDVRQLILHSQGPNNSPFPDGWYWLGEPNGVFSVSSCYKWIVHNIRTFPPEEYIWKKWKWRNNFIFNSLAQDVDCIFRKATLFIAECHTFLQIQSHLLHPEASLRWSPPDPGWFKLNVDGNFISSNHHMGAGGLIRDSFGRWLWGFSLFEDVGDVLLAELLAILRGLVVAQSMGLPCIVCESDSSSAVELLSNIRLVDGVCYAEVLSRIKTMINHFDHVSFRHISRRINGPADALARMSTRHRSLIHWREPPSEIQHLLYLDSCGPVV